MITIGFGLMRKSTAPRFLLLHQRCRTQRLSDTPGNRIRWRLCSTELACPPPHFERTIGRESLRSAETCWFRIPPPKIRHTSYGFDQPVGADLAQARLRKKRKLTSATCIMSARACFRRLGVQGRPTVIGVRWPASSSSSSWFPLRASPASPSYPQCLGFRHDNTSPGIRSGSLREGKREFPRSAPISLKYDICRMDFNGGFWDNPANPISCQNVTEESVTGTAQYDRQCSRYEKPDPSLC